MILLCKLPEDSPYYPYYIVDTDTDKMTYHYQYILGALRGYFRNKYRRKRYSVYVGYTGGNISWKLDITDLCTTSAEKTKAAICAKYPELLI
jgi:hypothetical protein